MSEPDAEEKAEISYDAEKLVPGEEINYRTGDILLPSFRILVVR